MLRQAKVMKISIKTKMKATLKTIQIILIKGITTQTNSSMDSKCSVLGKGHQCSRQWVETNKLEASSSLSRTNSSSSRISGSSNNSTRISPTITSNFNSPKCSNSITLVEDLSINNSSRLLNKTILITIAQKSKPTPSQST